MLRTALIALTVAMLCACSTKPSVPTNPVLTLIPKSQLAPAPAIPLITSETLPPQEAFLFSIGLILKYNELAIRHNTLIERIEAIQK